MIINNSVDTPNQLPTSSSANSCIFEDKMILTIWENNLFEMEMRFRSAVRPTQYILHPAISLIKGTISTIIAPYWCYLEDINKFIQNAARNTFWGWVRTSDWEGVITAKHSPINSQKGKNSCWQRLANNHLTAKISLLWLVAKKREFKINYVVYSS